MHLGKFSPSQWSSYLVQSWNGNIEFIIPDVSLKGSPDFQNTEVACERDSSKSVVLKKAMIFEGKLASV